MQTDAVHSMTVEWWW